MECAFLCRAAPGKDEAKDAKERAKRKSSKASGRRIVQPAAAATLVHDAEAYGRAEAALQLAAAVVSAEGGAHAGVVAADLPGLQVRRKRMLASLLPICSHA